MSHFFLMLSDVVITLRRYHVTMIIDYLVRFRMLKEFRSLGVFAAFSRWSLDVSLMQKQERYDYCLNSPTPKLPNSKEQAELAFVELFTL